MRAALDRRRLVQLGAALAASAWLPARAQEAKPPLRIIVPLPAGGVADTSVRNFAEFWTAATRQQVVVDNRPGGSFQIGMQQVLSAPADGNTWIQLNSGMSAAQVSFQRFDMNRQLATIGMSGSTPGAIFASPGSGIRSIKDMLDWIAANPGKLNYGAVTGGIEHMMMARILKRYGLTGTLVPFKGGPDACTALAQNEIQLAVSALPLIIPFKGRIVPIAVMTEQRAPMLPDLPTFREQGLDSPQLDYWGAFAVPAGTPPATVAALNKTMVEVLKVPALVQKLAMQGMVAISSSPEAMARIIDEEVKWMGPVASELNLKAG